MRTARYRLIVMLLGSVLATLPRAAVAEPEDPATVQRLQALEEELAFVKRKLEVQEEVAATRAKETPVIGAGKDGFFIQSQDKKFQLRLRGYTHFDGRFFTDAEDLSSPDTFLFRRVRPIFEGTLAEVIDFRIMPDFAGSTLVLQDAYVNLRTFPKANIQAGKYKAPFGLERLQSATAIMFVERGLPTNLVPNRDLGVMLHGILREGLFSYQLAFMNGVTDGGSADVDANDGKDFVGRIFAHPFQETRLEALRGLGVGVAASFGREEGATPTYRTSGQQTFFRYRADVVQAGDRWRYSPQAYWYWGPFGALAEYVYSAGELKRGLLDMRPNNTAWQVAASYVLTGENASYKGVDPRSPLSRGTGGWGAFELAARYSQLDVDDDAFEEGFADRTVAAESARAWAVGVNWYLNRYVKLVLNYERTEFDGGSDTRGDRPTEGVILTRMQLSY